MSQRDTVAALRKDVRELQGQVLSLCLQIEQHEVTKFVRELLDRIDSLHATAQIAAKERDRHIGRLSARIAQLEVELNGERKRLQVIAA